MLGKTTYLCNFVKIKGKSIFPLRGAQVNSNFVACVKDRGGNPAAKRGIVADSLSGRPNRKKRLWIKKYLSISTDVNIRG